MAAELKKALPSCTIANTRILSFNSEQVFEAFTDPSLLASWWGPQGFTNTFHEFDLKEGGRWRFTMHGPDRGHYPNECVFVSIRPFHFLAWDHYPSPRFQMQIKLEVVSVSSCRIHFTMVFDTPEECNRLRGFAEGKNEENLNKLEHLLQHLHT